MRIEPLLTELILSLFAGTPTIFILLHQHSRFRRASPTALAAAVTYEPEQIYPFSTKLGGLKR